MNVDPNRALALGLGYQLIKDLDEVHLTCGIDRATTIARIETDVRNSAETWLAWLRGPATLRLTAGIVRKQSTGLPSGTPTPQGDTMQIHDDEEFDLTLEELDAKGFATSTQTPPTWTSSDETVVPLAVSADAKTFTVVAGNPGSSVVTASVTLDDGTVLPDTTYAVDVTPAGVATVNMVAGPVRKQAPAAPAAEPTPGSTQTL